MEEQRFWIAYAPANHVYPIEIGIKKVAYDDVRYEPELIRGLCLKHCKNFGLSGKCPPKAPLFPDLADPGDELVFIYATFYPQFKTVAVQRCRQIYVHWRSQDQILTALLHQLGSKLGEQFPGWVLGAGHCRRCDRKKCTVTTDPGTCAHPQQRTFSMEATGINVVSMVQEHFGITLRWYKRDASFDLPMTKCGLLISKADLDLADVFKVVTHHYQLIEEPNHPT
ncbi:DUF2284 domain-containing protein [Heliophilum fasciatum]|uniref:Putative metal-binding protein n=1 Tax=Heliophilum fasciatum TaxID=35700 RepID=A0A4V2SWV6_9FIRM|nr:DUF2284 domain-containing protein [Heliophilum fasciatum]MCW2278251.1 putative metal-binding protein [Heliophilum fasciatum]TCP63876.1 putative metal-binding protein [Heliophilum fasciatum]